MPEDTSKTNCISVLGLQCEVPAPCPRTAKLDARAAKKRWVTCKSTCVAPRDAKIFVRKGEREPFNAASEQINSATCNEKDDAETTYL